jgi:hypothetical protein
MPMPVLFVDDDNLFIYKLYLLKVLLTILYR